MSTAAFDILIVKSCHGWWLIQWWAFDLAINYQILPGLKGLKGSDGPTAPQMARPRIREDATRTCRTMPTFARAMTLG